MFQLYNNIIIKMSISYDEETESPYQRSSFHEFATQAESNNFNVRKFNQRNNLKVKKQNIRTKYSDSSKYRVNTEPIEDKVKSMNVVSHTSTFDRFMNKKQPDYAKRMNLTGSLKHTNDRRNSISIMRLGKDREEKSLEVDIESQKAEKCRKLDRKFHKGPLNKKVIETWLNSILMQSTQFEVLDESLGNAALKKYEVDENSLLSRSIRPENIPKIYQSLFVHSIGFNNSLKQLASNNIEVMKNIWKVFSILLEYCAEGKFETLIGSIQREKTSKIDELRDEVAKRQQIIERNDELNETKNIQIFKEIKHLKSENINLTNEKQVLYEDYQKTEQAFNQQVALRLKFENKINELFGVHRELAIKHQRLYEDYKRKVIEWNNVNQKNTLLNQQNSQYKIQINELQNEKQRLMSSEKYSRDLTTLLKEQKGKSNIAYSLLKHEYDEQRRLTKQLNRRISQFEIEIKNFTEITEIKDKSWKQTHSEYQLSLEENKKLYSVISDQRKNIEELLYDKKEFNNTILNLMAEASFEKKKKEEFSQLYYETDNKNKLLIQRNKNYELEIKVLAKKNESIQTDIKINYENIQKMHLKNKELEDELFYLRRFRDSLDEVIEEKDTANEELKKMVNTLTKDSQSLKSALNRSELSNKMLKAELESEVENNRVKMQKIKEERQLLESSDNEKNRQLIIARVELQKAVKNLQNVTLNLKNEKFQRQHLKTNYDQSLAIIEKKNANEREMGREISQLKDISQRLAQQKNSISMALDNEVIRRQRVTEQLQTCKKQHLAYMQQKSSHVHPFIYQDVAQNYQKMKQKYRKSQIMIKVKVEEMKEVKEKHQIELKNINQSNLQFLEKFKQQKQKQIFLKQSELEYEKQVSTSMKARLEKLQTLAETYSKKIEERTTSDKERMYAEMVEQKTKSIEELMGKLKKETNKNEELKREVIKNIEQNENILCDLKAKFKKQQQEKQDKISDLMFDKKFFESEVIKLKAEIKQHEQKFEQKLKQSIDIYMKTLQIETSENQKIDQITQSLHEEERSEFKETKMKWSLMGALQKKNPEIKKRNEVSRKLQFAYTYYKK